MVSFNNLPNEVMRTIAGGCEPADLLSLCITSKACCDIFEPELFRNIRWTYFHSRKKTSKPIHRLLIAICQSPEIAAWIRHFAVYEEGFGPKPKAGSVFSSSELALLRSSLDFAGVVGVEGWMAELRGGSLETIVAMILLQLREVQSVTLDLFLRHDDDQAYLRDQGSRISQVFAHSVSAPEHLPANRFMHLKHISWPSESYLGPHCFLRRSEMPNVIPAAFLPSIESATLKIDQPGVLPEGKSGLIPQTSGLSQLQILGLRHSSIDDGTLALILSVTPMLRVLDVEFNRDMTCLDDTEAPGFHGPTLLNSLRSCQASLETLRIISYIDDPVLDIPWSFFFAHPLSSLQDFEGLTHLEVSLTQLLGCEQITTERLINTIPQSLTKLGIREDGYGIASVNIMEKAIHDFPAKAEPVMPDLKLVSVFLDLEVWGDERIKKMRDIYRPTRFRLVVKHVERLAPLEITGDGSTEETF
ncbi:hypothetical protein NW762_011151 [Fusarium torreyae]|uniref:F-box domain-containing protein n=1 Tax=Fusarium torreyae TaxID=1237075 RepID=A0A9W8RRI6_9HYPO|nr:hypothetical protein NW762_011151 [Fusarium torreyae]